MSDPFVHHPELLDQIKAPETSLFWDFNIENFRDILLAHGGAVDWWYSDDEREAMRAETMAGRLTDPLWVFGYGSLMWDPAFPFSEVRRAHLKGFERQFTLVEVHGARGTPEAPGLVAALDRGDECDGLAFRIEGSNVDLATEKIWRRERIAGGYKPVFVSVRTAKGELEALTFVADHSAEAIEPELTFDEQARMMATGAGMLGSSLDYLKGVAEHLSALGIEDPHVSELLAAAENLRSKNEVENG